MFLHPEKASKEELQTKLLEVQAEHHDFDLIVNFLEETPSADDLLIKRMKKRKLGLKDRLLHLEVLLKAKN